MSARSAGSWSGVHLGKRIVECGIMVGIFVVETYVGAQSRTAWRNNPGQCGGRMTPIPPRKTQLYDL